MPMKLGEGGEAFFVFETEGLVPSDLLTSPVVSPSASPRGSESPPPFAEPDFLDLSRARSRSSSPEPREEVILDETPSTPPPKHNTISPYASTHNDWADSFPRLARPNSPPPLTKEQMFERAQLLSRKLTDINIASKITDNGDVVLDITGYKSDEADIKQSEEVVRKILMEELGEDNLEQFLKRDDEGNLRIYGSAEEAGYTSDDIFLRPGSEASPESNPSLKTNSTFPLTGGTDSSLEYEKSYAKTLRLTSDQLKSLNLNSGPNDIAFSVNKAVCTAKMYYWKYNVPIVISDIDGTITKSDALGHVLAMIGRDWTHPGVGKLFTDISSNGYNIMYLTARSVGQADSTRSYLLGIEQNGFKLPEGPVILSPDRTMAALRREVIMRKPEVFKMACLRDIKGLYGELDETPFYAGFGNRITDALSYRSVGVPSSRIFTINSIGDVHMELLELAGYKSSYVHIADLVDHFFPPVRSSFRGEETYTDLNFWREPIADLSEWETDEDSVNNGTGRNYEGGNKKIDMARSPRRKDSRAAGQHAEHVEGDSGSPVRGGDRGALVAGSGQQNEQHHLQPPAEFYGDEGEPYDDNGLGYSDEEDDDDDDDDDDGLYEEDEDEDDYDEDAVDEDDSELEEQYLEDEDDDCEHDEEKVDGHHEEDKPVQSDEERIISEEPVPPIISATELLSKLNLEDGNKKMEEEEEEEEVGHEDVKQQTTITTTQNGEH